MSDSDEITKSTDPQLVAARIFVGNLPSDRISKQSLREKFSKHGKVLGCAVFKGFGFVQFDSPDVAEQVVAAENLSSFHGSRLEIRLASEGKKRLGARDTGAPAKILNHIQPAARSSNPRDIMDYGGGFSRGRSPDRRHPPFGGGGNHGGGGGGFRRADLVNQIAAQNVAQPPPPRDFDFREQSQTKQNQPWNSGDDGFNRGRGGDRDSDFRIPPAGGPMGEVFPNGRGKPDTRNFMDRSSFDQEGFSTGRPGAVPAMPSLGSLPINRASGGLPGSNLGSAFGGAADASNFLSRNPAPAEHARGLGGNWNPDPLDSNYGSTRKREASPAVAGPPAKRPELGLTRPYDAGILICKNTLRDYGEMIERRLMELNLAVDVMFLTATEDHVGLIVEQMAQKGMLYCVVIQKQHEAHKSITVNVLHGSPQEHRNMPLDDALVMLSRDFNTYLNKLRVGSEQPSVSFLLHLLTDGKHLSAGELERIVSHLEDRRKKMNGATNPSTIQPNITNPSDNKTAEERIEPQPDTKNSSASQLQQHIFKILGTGKNSNEQKPDAREAPKIHNPFGMDPNNPVHSTPAPPEPGNNFQPMPQAEGKPDIQKALAALLKNPDLLQSLKPPGSSQASSNIGGLNIPASSQSQGGGLIDPNRGGGIPSLLGLGRGPNEPQPGLGNQPPPGMINTVGSSAGNQQNPPGQLGQMDPPNVFGSPGRPSLSQAGMQGFNQMTAGLNQMVSTANLGAQFGGGPGGRGQQPTQVLPGSMFGSMIPPGNLMGPPQGLMGGPLGMVMAQQQQQQNQQSQMNQQGGIWNRGPPGPNRSLLG